MSWKHRGEGRAVFFLTIKYLPIYPLLHPRLACSPSRMMAWPIGISDWFLGFVPAIMYLCLCLSLCCIIPSAPCSFLIATDMLCCFSNLKNILSQAHSVSQLYLLTFGWQSGGPGWSQEGIVWISNGLSQPLILDLDPTGWVSGEIAV